MMDKKSTSQWKTLLTEIGKVFSTYFMGKLKIAFIIGILACVCFVILKIPYGIILGILIGVFNIIPFIGPIVGGGIAILVTLIVVDLSTSLWVLGVIILLQAIDGWYLEPKILGKTFGLSPLLIFIIIFVGGGLFGIPGMILAVPIAVIFRIIYQQIS